MMAKQEIEFVSFKPLKPNPNPNISEMVSKLSKVCKLRSIGVFNTPENPKNINPNDENGKDAEFDVVKNDGVQKDVIQCGHVEILKVFDTLLALKLAYVKLQEAHIRYDPEKIRDADGEVVSHLESLVKIKKTYKEKLLKGLEVHSGSACSSLLLAEIRVQEKELAKLKSRAENKEKRVVDLQRELRDLEMRNKKLAKEIMEREKESILGLSHYSLEDVVKAVSKAVHDFAKPLIALMKVSDWDLDRAANAIQNSAVYAKRCHKKFAFEAFVARRMFHGFSQQPFNVENIMKFDEPADFLIRHPKSSFAKFCREKYLLVVHPRIEASFFGNLDHRTLVSNWIHPNTPFYRAFVKMARWVWFLQGLSASIEPKAEMFGVKQGSEFSHAYMEVPEELKEYKALLDKGEERFKVEFMVMPGFRQGEMLIRSQVYVSKLGSPSTIQ